MAVNTSEILSVYDALMNKTKFTLSELFDTHSIKSEDKAKVISMAITQVIQTSAQLVQSQPLQDAQVAQAQAQTSAISAQSTADTTIKTKQGALIDAQKDVEVEKKALTTRQKTAYDDNLRVKEAEMLANIAGMMGAGGATFSTADSGSTTFLSTMYSKIDAITQ